MIEFSAIVHTYNRAHLLPRALEAIRQQTYPASELILIDDGSEDQTAKIVREQFPEFKYLRINNSGPGAARKAGAEAASKPWLVFCDDDDHWLDNHLERRVALIERFPEADFTCSNFGAFGALANPHYNHYATAPEGWWEKASEVEDGSLRLLHRNAFRHCLKFNPAYPLVWAIRRDFYERTGGIEQRYSRWQNEDTAYFRKCLLNGRIACDREITAKHHRHEMNFSRVQFKNWSGKADILKDFLDRGMIPEIYQADVITEIEASERTACLQVFWTKEYRDMLAIYRKLPVRSVDFKLRARALLALVLGLRSRRVP